jgi:uridylate kinase
MEIIVISLGGSLIVPDNIDVKFLKKFKRIILNYAAAKKFIIICGGGRTARRYQEAAADVSVLKDEDLDWLGIHSTRLNAHLLRTIFRGHAHPAIIKNPTEKIKFNERILIASGWQPGCSTDYDAVLLAKNFNIKDIINLSNTDYVYDSDPRKNKDARPLPVISWMEFRKLVGNEWNPGLNMPFDPVASKLAEELGMKVVIMKDLANLESFLGNKKFNGTVIS